MSEWRFERPPNLPLPQPTEEAQPFFDALKERRLVVQGCSNCGALQHPPRAMCGSCQSMAFQWAEMSGKGVVYSYVVTHQAVHPALVGHTPLATVEVELAEGPHITSNLVDVPPQAVTIGTAVEAVFEEVAAGVVLVLFRRSGTADSATSH